MRRIGYTLNCLEGSGCSLMSQRLRVFESDKGKPAGMRGRKAIGSQDLIPEGGEGPDSQLPVKQVKPVW